MDASPPRPAAPWRLIVPIAVVGLALRIAAARGGLWLDEAWSAVFARDVSTPAGILLSINHDNNHHLNTLWLQFVGLDASPLAQRGLSIAAGTLTILVAGALGGRRGTTAGVVTALLFALSPILVTYGSEARGYAPMLLALVTALLVVERWLDDAGTPSPAATLAIIVVLGMVSQLTMIFGIAALAGWAVLRAGLGPAPRPSIGAVARAFAPALAVAAGAIALVFGVAESRGGFQIGSYQPFAGVVYVHGLSDALRYTLGLPTAFGALLVAAAVGALMLPSLRQRVGFHALALLGLPLAALVLHLGNSGIARYYLLSVVALLLVLAEDGGWAVRRGGGTRWLALGLVVAVCGGSLSEDVALVRNQRADPAAAIAAMRARAPDGTTVALDQPRASAVIDAASASARYRVSLAQCGRFLFVDRDGDTPFPHRPARCGRHYRVIAEGHPTGLSGTHWMLYTRE